MAWTEPRAKGYRGYRGLDNKIKKTGTVPSKRAVLKLVHRYLRPHGGRMDRPCASHPRSNHLETSRVRRPGRSLRHRGRTYIHDRDRWHTTNAMYGALAVQVTEGPNGEMATREVRHPDGYFGATPDWRNRNVSGVLLVNQLMPYDPHRAEVTVWRHPDPLRELPDRMGLPGYAVALDGGRLAEHSPGSIAAEFFGLPDPWPPGNPWPKED